MRFLNRLMALIVAAMCVGTWPSVWAEGMAGGLSPWTAWSFHEARTDAADGPEQPPAVFCESSGASAVRGIIAWPDTPFRAAVRIRTQDVRPHPSGGYAYAAVYEFDELGNVTAEFGEYREGAWHPMAEIAVPPSDAEVRLPIPADCLGEVIRIRRR